MALVDAHADCLDCGWETYHFNAFALAAQHHRKTGHQVMAEQTFSRTWLRVEPEIEKVDQHPEQ